MTQFLIEEAVNVAYDVVVNQEMEADQAARQPDQKPGEITDPVMAEAMEKAKAMHAEQFGVRV